MDPKQILKTIIEEEGSCNWIANWASTCRICDTCPLSTKNGGNCGDLMNIALHAKLTTSEADLKYKKLAEDKLLDLEMESLLNGEYDD